MQCVKIYRTGHTNSTCYLYKILDARQVEMLKSVMYCDYHMHD